MSYLKDLKLILTLHVNQFLINMEKRIFALLRGLLIVPSKETASKIVRTGRMRSIWIFSSIFIQRNRCINLLPSSPPPLPPPPLQTRFLYTFYKATNWCWWEGGGEDLSLFWYRTPSSFNKHSIVYSQPFFWSKRPISYRESDIGSQIPFCSLERKRYLALMFHNT